MSNNFSLTTFSSDGSLNQVNYAITAANNGETTLAIEGLDKYIVLADGPAGLKLVKKYGIDEKGVYRLCDNIVAMRMKDYLSEEEWKKVDTLENNLDRKGTVYYQYATAIPTATASALQA